MTNPLPDTAITDEQVDRRNLIASVIARHFNDDRPTGTLPADEKLADTICAALTAAAQVGKDSPTAADMRAFGANEAACYKWPDDTLEHRTARAAYCQGAADYGGAAQVGNDRRGGVIPRTEDQTAEGCSENNPVSPSTVVGQAPTTPGRAVCTCGQSGHGNAHEPGCPMSDYRPVRSERQERLAESGAEDGPVEYALTAEQLKELERRYHAYAVAVNKPGNGEKEWTDLTMGMLGALPALLREIWRGRFTLTAVAQVGKEVMQTDTAENNRRERLPETPPGPAPTTPGRADIHGYQSEKSCCTICDIKRQCHVCGDQTLLACSDCRINFGATVYVCKKQSCRDEHERKCYGCKP